MSLWNVPHVTEELNFKLFLTFLNMFQIPWKKIQIPFVFSSSHVRQLSFRYSNTRTGDFPQKPMDRHVVSLCKSLRLFCLFTKKGIPVWTEVSFENVWCLFGKERRAGSYYYLSSCAPSVFSWMTFPEHSLGTRHSTELPGLLASALGLGIEKQVGAAETWGQDRWTLGLCCPWVSLKFC